jgi:putative flavoprotein involved in K+ transport
MNGDQKTWPVIVVGGGQSGLAAGYYLKQMKTDFIILDENPHTGDSWKNRWDTLHLFTPARHDGLPGMKFPSQRNGFPGKDQVAKYLSDYSDKFQLPVRHNIKVKKIRSENSRYQLYTSDGIFQAKKVVIATGTHPIPKIPDFAVDLSKEILQIHSSDYKNPEILPEGDVLVVGAGTSGVEIALEVSKYRKTCISGNPTFHIPDNVFKYAGGLYWWAVKNILTVKTPVGRKFKQKVLKGGGPLINISIEDLEKAGVTRLQRMKGALRGMPVMEDDTAVNVRTVIWCTGYRPDFSWMDMDVRDESGWPVTERGISKKQEGLFFMGMPFQYGLASGLIGGVGRDAAHVVRELVNQ